jgi:hypothetical protein
MGASLLDESRRIGFPDVYLGADCGRQTPWSHGPGQRNSAVIPTDISPADNINMILVVVAFLRVARSDEVSIGPRRIQQVKIWPSLPDHSQRCPRATEARYKESCCSYRR